MTVTVVMPWRPGCPHREAALAWTAARWQQLGAEPVLGEGPDGPWCKAAAIAAGLAATPGGGVLVVADADVWCDGIGEALAAVGAGAPWAIPHGKVYRLTAHATSDVLAGAAPGGQPTEGHPYRGFEGGGLVVLRRELYDQAPLDRRFAGWGQEDEAWALALRALAGPPWRGTAPLYHLWHPPQPRRSRRWGSPEGRALYLRYRRAARRPDRMRDLIAEGVTAGA